ncbi:bacteriocin biosynthesis protein [Pseudoalteromonas rubra]|uniref:Bacteriocin biosynthesis protein n=1 Tax=Pseudoalteromonas rubra TaxID=43658 RepID=A0A4Q7EMJ5_9GAMM|nr:YcaO-like family protein [Pseudoalteromonas rubra]RZM85470.1 bacteriocin biosynthesis protein [Pseudoalteromonas rubra]
MYYSNYKWKNKAIVYSGENKNSFVIYEEILYQFPAEQFPNLELIGKPNAYELDIDGEIAFMRTLELMKRFSLVEIDEEINDSIPMQDIKTALEKSEVETFNSKDNLYYQALEVGYQKYKSRLIYIFGQVFIAKNNIEFVDALEQLLLSNNPIRNIVNNLNVEKEKPPFIKKSELDAVILSKLIEKSIEEVNRSSKQIIVEISLHDCSSKSHNAEHLTVDPFCLVNEQEPELKLNPIACIFDQDGGSRSKSPSATLNELLPFVSNKLGLVTHIEELSDSHGNPIKIYRTGFYKGPYTSLGRHNSSLVQICLGKGVDPVQSKVSGICEAIERKNAQYCGNEPSTLSLPENLPHRYISFSDLLPYSQTQIESFADPNSQDFNRKQAVVSYDNSPVNWYKAWSLTNSEYVYVPLVCCFANTPFNDVKYGFWHSNGCAAGNNKEEAILQALLELIERDSTSIWWYNKLVRPEFDISRIESSSLALIKQSIGSTHDFWVLDITNDSGIPAMAAIGKNKKDNGFIFGFGCHLKPEMAAQRALTELCQLIPIRDQNGAPFDFNSVEDEDFLYPSKHLASTTAYTDCENMSINDCVSHIVSSLHELNMEVIAFEYTRKFSPVSTVKVFVPGLCHIWPQLGNPRLYQTPVKLGWLEQPLTEQTINQQGLYI